MLNSEVMKGAEAGGSGGSSLGGPSHHSPQAPLPPSLQPTCQCRVMKGVMCGCWSEMMLMDAKAHLVNSGTGEEAGVYAILFEESGCGVHWHSDVRRDCRE